jgi:hypothetical protein
MIKEEHGRQRCRLTVTIKFSDSFSGGPFEFRHRLTESFKVQAIISALEADMFGGGTGLSPRLTNTLTVSEHLQYHATITRDVAVNVLKDTYTLQL